MSRRKKPKPPPAQPTWLYWRCRFEDCGKNMRVKTRRALKVTCPHCHRSQDGPGRMFPKYYGGDEAPTKPPRPAAPAAAARPATPPAPGPGSDTRPGPAPSAPSAKVVKIKAAPRRPPPKPAAAAAAVPAAPAASAPAPQRSALGRFWFRDG